MRISKQRRIKLKKLCEIYDISKEYDKPSNSLLVLVSDIEKSKLILALPELKSLSDKIMSKEDWNKFLDINNTYRRNDNKFYMREVRQSQREEITQFFYSQTDDLSILFDNDELREKIDYALSFLKEQPKRRFLKHYSEQLTYRQIAKEEGKQISTVFESVQYAKKIFIKKLSEYSK